MIASSKLPLTGIVVAERGDSLAGAIAGFLLGELGAAVVKVSDTPADRPALSMILDRNKTFGSEGAWATADAVLDGSEAGMPPANESAVVVRVDPDGAGSLRRSAGLLAEASSGIMNLQQGHRDGPYCLAAPIAACGAGLVAAIAACIGLLVRERGGTPETLAIDNIDGALAMQSFSACFHVDPHAARPATRFADPYCVSGTPLIRFYPIADGWILLGVPTFPRFVKLCLLMNREDLLIDPRFADAPFGITDQSAATELVGIIGDYLRPLSQDEVERRFVPEGLLVSPVLDHQSGLRHPQLIANGLVVDMAEDGGDHRTVVANFVQYLTAAPSKRVLPPLSAGAIGAAGPLAGVKVVDAARFMAAPLVSRILGDLGAEVIKVEPPDGDPVRSVGLSFAATNRGKHSIGLDLRQAEGRDLLARLVADCDAVITNALPGAASELGLDPGQLQGYNPDAVVLDVLGYGRTGPLAGRPVIDANAQSLSGGALAQGGGTEPMGFMGGVLDNGTGWLGALGVLAALIGRQRRNLAFTLETSLLNTAAFTQLADLCDPAYPQDEHLDADRRAYSPTRGLYEAADGWLCLDAGDETTQDALCAIVGSADCDHIADLIRRRGVDEWLGRFAAVGLNRAVRVRTLEEAARHDAGRFVAIEQIPWGRVLQIAPLPRREDPVVLDGAPDIPGRDNEAILSGQGRSAAEISELRRRGVIIASESKLREVSF
jgi:crotonobetainyl-CoA:carnitine CoA-transferase CaiB-like acyl-CoA transferase